jgi:hypothetical protein
MCWGQLDLLTKAKSTLLVDYHPGSPKNMGWVGGFYFIIYIFPKKLIDGNFIFINKTGVI